MTSGWLPFWGWLLILAALLVIASFEYAHRRSTIGTHARRTVVSRGSPRKMIGLIGMVVCGLGLIGFTFLYFWPARDNPPGPTATANQRPLTHPTAPQPSPQPVPDPAPKVLLKPYNAADRVRLDEALYKLFDIITVVHMPLQRDAEVNLVHNWEGKMTTPNQGPNYFLAEIDRIRKNAVAGHQQIHDIIYKNYNYYIEELRDAVIEGRTVSFFATLDAFRGVVNALPANPTMDQLRVLAADKHKAFAQGVLEYGRWVGDARRKIEQKRDYILTLQGSH